jgi:hypothetical protein
VTIDQSGGQFRIVTQDGADADQDGVAAGPQAMGKGQRCRAAQTNLASVACGDTAVQALGVCENDERPTPLPAKLFGACQLLFQSVEHYDPYLIRLLQDFFWSSTLFLIRRRDSDISVTGWKRPTNML